MLIQKQQPYYIATPYETGTRLKTALMILVFAGIASGIFFGACLWARGTVRGLEVTIAPYSICETCGRVLDGNVDKHGCEVEK